MARRPALAGLALAFFAASCAFLPPPRPQAGRPNASQPTSDSSTSTARALATDLDAAEHGLFDKFARVSAVGALAAMLLVGIVAPTPAEAARSGGRMGGMGSAARRPPPPPNRAAQQARSGGPNINIGVSPMIGGGFYGGYGPSLFGPSLFGPTILPVPLGGLGPSASDQMLQQQQRRDESVMDSQAKQIEALQKELAEVKARK